MAACSRVRGQAAMEHSGNLLPVTALRLADLRLWHVVIARWAICRHQRRLPISELTFGRHEDVPLRELLPKLRCGRCGNRSGNGLTVAFLSRN